MSQRLGQVDCTNAEYHGGPGISKSHLDWVERSPRHYWQAYVNPNRPPRETTPVFVLGSAIHSAVLEPDLFPLEYVCEPDDAPARPTSRQLGAKKPSDASLNAIAYWNDFDIEHAGKTTLTAKQHAVAIGCRDAVLRHGRVRQLLLHGRAETSYYAIDPATGALIKCRTDWENPVEDMIVDLKSTVSASERGFLRSVVDYRYHVQQPWYQDTIEAALDTPAFRRWRFLAIEKTEPYAMGLYSLPDDMVRAGRRAAQHNLARILACREADHWPDFAEDDIELLTPGWMQTRLDMNSPEHDFA